MTFEEAIRFFEDLPSDKKSEVEMNIDMSPDRPWTPHEKRMFIEYMERIQNTQ